MIDPDILKPCASAERAFAQRHRDDRNRAAPVLFWRNSFNAVASAVGEAKKALIHDHFDHCLEAAVDPASREARAPVEELKTVAKYL
jgi:hypothetical protein